MEQPTPLTNEQAQALQGVPAWTDEPPAADGWWLRNREGRPKWFSVRMTSESGEPPLRGTVYLGDLQRMVPVAELTNPLDWWFGPVLTERDSREGKANG